jgi:hypothetical protein
MYGNRPHSTPSPAVPSHSSARCMSAVHGPDGLTSRVFCSTGTPVQPPVHGPSSRASLLATTRNCNAHFPDSLFVFFFILSSSVEGNCCTFNLRPCTYLSVVVCARRRLPPRPSVDRPGPRAHRRDPAPLLPPRRLSRYAPLLLIRRDQICDELAVRFMPWAVGIRRFSFF